ncbi:MULTISPECIES: hypothetical protein [Bacteroidales]|uniref:Uncharacterized protein n=1 Tax=Parabacteroides distasonis TaxID=823 RepID=A0A4S2EPQ1_PARDI|nr:MULTISPECIES: hypothetical protein [Bacteroidales]RLT67498.1 hypothetical protein D7V92_21390 [Parabacteroides sp. CH2-D42-20]TGY56181.1 hypothetical protein E5342_12670 [Parabacteroides distasonis]
MSSKTDNNIPNGNSYEKRVIEVNGIYDEYSRSGLSNREIWRRYIWPIYGISEKTFYNYLNKAYKFSSEQKLQKRR